jgi:transcriptional regulator with XRE-family HTH domain
VVGEVWKVIRADYARRWDAIKPIGRRPRAHGATQRTVAEHGGLAGQNAVSRILNGGNDGPTVETFVRGLIGLGVRPSEFFAAIEDQFPIPAIPPAWAPAANAQRTEPRRSPADDVADARRTRLLKAGDYAQRLHELLAQDVRSKKRR